MFDQLHENQIIVKSKEIYKISPRIRKLLRMNSRIAFALQSSMSASTSLVHGARLNTRCGLGGISIDNQLVFPASWRYGSTYLYLT